jgi:two-component system, response regulator YesN
VIIKNRKSEDSMVHKEVNDIGFDLEGAKKAARVYSRSTGIESFIINSKGEILYESCYSSNLCQFCREIKSANSPYSACASVHLYGSYQAERFGGKYVYFCPLGLVHWASPIIINNFFQGALIGGPVLMVDPDEFLLEDIIRNNGVNEDQLDQLNEYVQRVPVIQPDIVNSLSELLYIVSSSLSNNVSSNQNNKREYFEHQSEISETVHYIKMLESDENSKGNYPFEKERELLSSIAVGDKAASQKILNEILGYVFFSSGKDFEIIKARVLELVVLLSRAAVEGGADSEEIFGLNYKYLTDIHSFKSVEELTFWLTKIMARFTDCVFNLADVRHKDIIYKAVDYIKRKYMERITLEDVAMHVYLTPSYFSKIFKSEMKCNFVTYVNKMRINASKALLSNISIPLTEISNIVGFEDQSYFTKVFKKSTGITPGKFRESRGSIKATKQ